MNNNIGGELYSDGLSGNYDYKISSVESKANRIANDHIELKKEVQDIKIGNSREHEELASKIENMEKDIDKRLNDILCKVNFISEKLQKPIIENDNN